MRPGSWPPESFLGRLTAAERDALLACGHDATHEPGQVLLTNGDRGGGFVLLLLRGHAKVVTQGELGNDYLIGIRTAGSLLGEMSFFDGRPRSASVVAVTEVRTNVVAGDRLELYLKDHPRVGLEIARVLVARLRTADASSRDLRNDAVPLRVAKLLATLSDDFDGGPIPLSQAELAQLANAAEVTVNRTLRDFRDQGVVLTRYRQLVVPCLACLRGMVAAVAADPKRGAKTVVGCGGTQQHRPQ